MSKQLYTNNAISLSENVLSPTDVILNVIPGDGDLFPQPANPGDFFLITLEDSHAPGNGNEIIKVTGKVGDTFFIEERGFEGTTPRTWPADTLVDHRITAFTLQKIEQVKGAISNPDDPNIVNPGNALVSDTYTVQFPNALSCKWIVTVLDEVTGRIAIAEVLAAFRPAPLNPSYTVYAKTGDNLKFSLSVIASGNDMRLNVNNTDIVQLRINCIRLNY